MISLEEWNAFKELVRDYAPEIPERHLIGMMLSNTANAQQYAIDWIEHQKGCD